MTAIRECRKLGIPIVSILDTNCDPDLVDIPIPGNDDAVRSIKLILKSLTDSIIKGKYLVFAKASFDSAIASFNEASASSVN
jgi:ribosomal protein S2